MKKFKTRPVSPSEMDIYWQRSEECWNLAWQAFQDSKWFGGAINIIHAIVALADLMCIRYAGKRYAGEDHEQAVDFYTTLNLDDPDFKKSVSRLGRVLSVKTEAEYGGSPLKESEIRQMMKSAERFRNYVLQKLGKK